MPRPDWALVAGVPVVVPVGVFLVRVGDHPAVVAQIPDAVFIEIRLVRVGLMDTIIAGVPHAVPVGIQLIGNSLGAVITIISAMGVLQPLGSIPVSRYSFTRAQSLSESSWPLLLTSQQLSQASPNCPDRNSPAWDYRPWGNCRRHRRCRRRPYLFDPDFLHRYSCPGYRRFRPDRSHRKHPRIGIGNRLHLHHSSLRLPCIGYGPRCWEERRHSC